MKNICVVGVGYVGLTTGTCLADMGNRVFAIDVSAERVENLRKGILPIYEPGLKEMVERNTKAGRLSFSLDYAEGLKDAEFVFICVGTPEGVDGEADLQYVRAAAETIAKTMDHKLIVINKSTVPVGTGDWVSQIITSTQPKPVPFAVVSCPEFLREGSAVRDFLAPDRTVLGSVDQDAANAVAQLYLPLRAPIVVTDLRTAEMIKYASNAFLATRISFINEIANICEALGADVKEVAQGMGYDKRIGHSFLEAGTGYGGSCFLPGETVYVVNEDGSLTSQTLESLFAEAGTPYAGNAVEVISPTGKFVLAFDLESGCPAVAPVEALTRRPYLGDLVTISTRMGRTLTVTADHPAIRRTETGFEKISSGRVQIGDQLMALTELPPLVKPPTQLNLIELLRGTSLAQDVMVSSIDDSFAEQWSRYNFAIPKDLLKYTYDVKSGNRMSLPLFWYLSDRGLLDISADKLQLYTAKSAATKLNAMLAVDSDLMRLCGYYLAEGWISIDVGRANAQRERVAFTFHANERDYITDVQRILSSYGLKFMETTHTNATTTKVSSRIFAWVIRDILGCGTGSSNKVLPRWSFNLPVALRHELIRGAISGDGALTTVQKGKNMMVEYATVSKLLADGMSLLLQSIGIVPSIRRRMMNKSKQLAYIIRINGYEQLMQLTNVFGGKRRAQMTGILAGYERHIMQHGFSRQDETASIKVMKVESRPVEMTVYSLETSLHTVIVGSGLVSSNCFPKDVKALAYMAQVNGKHPELLQSVMEINDGQRRGIVQKLRDVLGDLDGKVVGILGLSFKENTDDLRESPSLHIAQLVHEAGAIVRGFDPVAMENVARSYPHIKLTENSYDLATGCDALVVATPWNEFKQLDMAKIKSLMRQPVLIDGRNLYNPEMMQAHGFTYRGVGRGYNGGSDHKAATVVTSPGD